MLAFRVKHTAHYSQCWRTALMGFAVLALASLHIGWLDPVMDDVEEANRQYLLGNYDEAIKKYTQALGERPDLPELHYNVGNALMKKGNPQEAAKEYQSSATATEDKALRAKAFYNLGNSYLMQNQPGQAVEAYKKALRLNPKDQDAKYNLEMALLQLLARQQPQDNQQQQDKQHNPTPSVTQTTTPQQEQQQQQATPTRSESGEMQRQTATPTMGQQTSSAETPGDSPTPLERQQYERLLDRLDQKELEIRKQLHKTPGPIHVDKDW